MKAVLSERWACRAKNWKHLQLKKIFYSKTTIYLSLGLHEERPSYRRSLQLSKENIQHFKTWNFLIFFYFCGSFLPAWIRINWPDWIRIQFGSRSGGYLPLPTGRPLFLAGTEARSSPFLFLPTSEVFRDLPPSPTPAFTTEHKASEWANFLFIFPGQTYSVGAQSIARVRQKLGKLLEKYLCPQNTQKAPVFFIRKILGWRMI